ncbi:hypothetical protein HQ545_00840 [Candidatus Woesearchaeota archaeon]|nr:hypothetical protein [Candidatus Woesearchaeota archaeon]
MRKKNELDDLGLSEDDIIEFDENEKAPKTDDIELNFIYLFPKACPICGGDVKGNDHFHYYCRKCNILFDRDHLSEGGTCIRKTSLTSDERKELEKKRSELSERMNNVFSEKIIKEDLPKTPTQEEPIQKPDIIEPTTMPSANDLTKHLMPEPTVEEDLPDAHEEIEEVIEESPEPVKTDYALENENRIIASSQSTKMHSGACHFVKKIHPENRIYLGSIKDGESEGYEMCVCLRRLKAKK